MTSLLLGSGRARGAGRRTTVGGISTRRSFAVLDRLGLLLGHLLLLGRLGLFLHGRSLRLFNRLAGGRSLPRKGGLTGGDVTHPMTSMGRLSAVRILVRSKRKLSNRHRRRKGTAGREKALIEHAVGAVRLVRSTTNSVHVVSLITSEHGSTESVGGFIGSVVCAERKGMTLSRSIGKARLAHRRDKGTVVRCMSRRFGKLIGKELRRRSNRAAEGLVGAISRFSRVRTDERGSDHALVGLEGFLGAIKELARVRRTKHLGERKVVALSIATAHLPMSKGSLAVLLVLEVRRTASEVLEVSDSTLAATKTVVHLTVGNVEHLGTISPVWVLLRWLQQGKHAAGQSRGAGKKVHGGMRGKESG